MATANNTPSSRKRVEATVLKRARHGSAFTQCEACKKMPLSVSSICTATTSTPRYASASSCRWWRRPSRSRRRRGRRPLLLLLAQARGRRAMTRQPEMVPRRQASTDNLLPLHVGLQGQVQGLSHPVEKGVADVGEAAGEK